MLGQCCPKKRFIYVKSTALCGSAQLNYNEKAFLYFSYRVIDITNKLQIWVLGAKESRICLSRGRLRVNLSNVSIIHLQQSCSGFLGQKSAQSTTTLGFLPFYNRAYSLIYPIWWSFYGLRCHAACPDCRVPPFPRPACLSVKWTTALCAVHKVPAWRL